MALRGQGSQSPEPPDTSFVFTARGMGHSTADAAASAGEARKRGGQKPLRHQQKLLLELEAQLHQKQLEYQRAEDEKQCLSDRIKDPPCFPRGATGRSRWCKVAAALFVLETILPVRERQLQVLASMQQASAVAPPPSERRLRPPQQALPWVARPEGPHNASMSSESGSADGLPCLFGDSAKPLEETPEAAAMGSDSASVPLPVATVLPAGVPPGPAGVPAHVLREVMGTWHTWVREAGLQLHMHDARPTDPEPRLKMAEMYDKLLSPCLKRVRLEYGTAVNIDLLSISMDSGRRVEPPSDAFWVSVVKGLRLNPDQISDYRAVMSLYRDRVGNLLAERRTLTDRLQVGMQALDARLSGSVRGLPAPQERIELHEVTTLLQRNVHAEARTAETLRDFLASRFSVMDIVRVSVLAYPYFPDPVALVSAVVDTYAPRAPCAPTVGTASGKNGGAMAPTLKY
ncbi:hypothetical protein HYH03_018749 [Edaphochlamys debaryana]|uniref:Uncharacterized protein n=1 Tax=Edaphochlamys debaryana TaxID=47281 RepID=A0A836BN04_9CHLO|nr:hypothetical protein HYH03_018749 [Edaphochlamys debaryana]|eukprot:KAG2482307.1 hypothetical protein HYH03_018749 [Edaphochlamys debaryana]